MRSCDIRREENPFVSAIAGLLSPDPAAGRSRLEKIHQALSHRGSHGRVEQQGPASLAQRAWDKACPHQPLAWNSLHVVADGVLYNREELRPALGAVPPEASDAELIARAYTQWGTACPEHLDGDFAFALWDEAHQRLFCARDPLGIRPFFYRWDGHTLAWASEVKALAADPNYAAAPDEAMIGEFLLGWSDFLDTSATFYRDIRQLPGGHWLRLEDGKVQTGRYWDINPEEACSRSFEESVEGFRALFAGAVQKRLGADGRSGILISGGLDSTSIGSWAEHWLRAEGNARGAPHYFSYVVPDARGDERGFLRAFEEKYTRTVHYLEIKETRILEGIEADADLRENAFLDPGWEVNRRLATAMSREGCRTVVSGLGGDNIFPSPGPGTFLDTGRRHGLRAGWRSYRETCAYFGVPRRTFLGPTLRLLLPGPVKRRAKRWLGREIPEWIEPRFAQRSGLLARVRQPLPQRGLPTHTQEEDYREVTSGRVALMLGYYERVGAALGLEFRHPFFDPALVRFTLLTPPEHKIRNGETKLLLRQAMENILPEAVRQRRLKGSLGPFLMRWAREREAARWRSLATTAAGSAGYVKDGQVGRWVERFLGGDDEALRPAWNLLSLELWLREGFGA
jgi:asparagine synthase (glutamine-hydrolysing)